MSAVCDGAARIERTLALLRYDGWALTRESVTPIADYIKTVLASEYGCEIVNGSADIYALPGTMEHHIEITDATDETFVSSLRDAARSIAGGGETKRFLMCVGVRVWLDKTGKTAGLPTRLTVYWRPGPTTATAPAPAQPDAA